MVLHRAIDSRCLKSRDKTRRIANIAKLPELLRKT
jgi:hypothetical protein